MYILFGEVGGKGATSMKHVLTSSVFCLSVSDGWDGIGVVGRYGRGR